MQENTEEKAAERPKMLYDRCRRCRRSLSNPKAQEIGYGKVCAGKVGLPASSSEDKDGETPLAPQLTEPFTGDVHLTRSKEGLALSNIPRTVIWHSPDGYEWGYGGSGPADLALNILNAFVPPGTDGEEPERCHKGVCSGTAARMHQDFKRDFLCHVEHYGTVIKADDIREWIETQKYLASDIQHASVADDDEGGSDIGLPA